MAVVGLRGPIAGLVQNVSTELPQLLMTGDHRDIPHVSCYRDSDRSTSAYR